MKMRESRRLMTMVAVAMAVAVAVAVGDKGEVARGVTTSYATDTRGRRFMSMCRHIRSFCWDQEKEKNFLFAIEKLPKLNFREVPLEVEVEMHFRQ